MRLSGGSAIVILASIPALVSGQDVAPAPIDGSSEPLTAQPVVAAGTVTFELADLPEAPVSSEAGRLARGDCLAQPVLPGDDPGIVVCGRRERRYASISKDYDKGGWAEPPLPPADPTTLTTGSCLQITCLPPPTVNYLKVIDTLFKIGKKIIEGE